MRARQNSLLFLPSPPLPISTRESILINNSLTSCPTDGRILSISRGCYYISRDSRRERDGILVSRLYSADDDDDADCRMGMRHINRAATSADLMFDPAPYSRDGGNFFPFFSSSSSRILLRALDFGAGGGFKRSSFYYQDTLTRSRPGRGASALVFDDGKIKFAAETLYNATRRKKTKN